MSLLEIKKLSYTIGQTSILRNIDLAVRDGEYLSLIGPNGAGKTTVLRCIMRIIGDATGSIIINGAPLDSYSQRKLAQIVSYVPQSDSRGLPFTIEEFLLMGRYPYLSPFTSFTKNDRASVNDALELTGIGGLAHRRLDTLSGGERQTAAIAAALVQGGRIMLLDEPTTFLDPKHESDVLELMSTINRERHITVLSVTHNINAAALNSDRIAVMKHGRIHFSGTPSEVMTNNVLSGVYGKKFLFADHPEGAGKIILPEAAS